MWRELNAQMAGQNGLLKIIRKVNWYLEDNFFIQSPDLYKDNN